MYPTCVQQNSQLKSTMTVAILIYRRKTLRQPPDDLQARVRVKIRFRHLYFPTAICSENPPPHLMLGLGLGLGLRLGKYTGGV